jgi:transposase
MVVRRNKKHSVFFSGIVIFAEKHHQKGGNRMLIKTILNRIQKHAHFVYGACRFVEETGRPIIEVEIKARDNSQPICSGCGKRRPGYDTLPSRRFEFVPLWGIPVFFLYAMRRVECPTCGVKVERVPWAQGKNRLTTTYAWFLARWSKRLSWKDVADIFHTSWDSVVRSVKMAVAWGLAHRNLDGITAIGIDEIAWKKGPKFATLVYQVDNGTKRLLWIGRDRTAKTLLGFFDWFGQDHSNALRFVCSDMWKPYLRIVTQKACTALNVLDRFHIAKHMNISIDKIRAQETRELKAKGKEPTLTHSRWCLLKRPENLTEKQDVKLRELLACNLKTIRAYLLKEDFQFFWEYKSAGWAGKFLDKWCTRTMRSRLKPMKKVAKMLRSHHELLLNWFRAKGHITLGTVEGLNNKVKVTTKRSYGFRSFDLLKIALYQAVGDLPEPKFSHKFC